VICIALAVNVMLCRLNVTPTGASPPAAGVAITVFIPGVEPSVQQTLVNPFASVLVEALEPNVPHVCAGVASGATTPPP
jgi:hypothetical protein